MTASHRALDRPASVVEARPTARPPATQAHQLAADRRSC